MHGGIPVPRRRFLLSFPPFAPALGVPLRTRGGRGTQSTDGPTFNLFWKITTAALPRILRRLPRLLEFSDGRSVGQSLSVAAGRSAGRSADRSVVDVGRSVVVVVGRRRSVAQRPVGRSVDRRRWSVGRSVVVGRRRRRSVGRPVGRLDVVFGRSVRRLRRRSWSSLVVFVGRSVRRRIGWSSSSFGRVVSCWSFVVSRSVGRSARLRRSVGQSLSSSLAVVTTSVGWLVVQSVRRRRPSSSVIFVGRSVGRPVGLAVSSLGRRRRLSAGPSAGR